MSIFLSLPISSHSLDQIARQSEEGDATDALLHLHAGVRLEDRGVLHQLGTDTAHQRGECRASLHHVEQRLQRSQDHGYVHQVDNWRHFARSLGDCDGRHH